MRRALVTGGNRGIGLAIAQGLVDQGIDVLIGCRDPESGGAAAAEIGATFAYCDLSEPMSIPAQAQECDILVNNAGVLFDEPLFSEPARFAETMNVMVRGPYALIRAALGHMTDGKYGRIVNISSGWGRFSEGLRGPGAYGIAKAGLNALTLAASRQLPANVKINAVDPGWVQTRMGGKSAPRTREQGADTAIWLATLPDDGPTGGFFRDRQPIDW